MTTAFASKFVEINGIHTHYHEEGNVGAEKIVLIHGSGPGVSALANWRLVMPRLGESLHVFAPDVVGFGQTDKMDKADYKLELWVDHLIGFIDEVVGGPVYLVGNSFGGAMVLHIAQRRPDLVKKLIMMGAVGVEHQITPGLDKVWGYEPSFENMQSLIKLFSYDDSAANDDDLVQMRYEGSIVPETRDAFRDMFFENRQERVNEISLPDDVIRKIETKTLLFHGLNDQVIPFEETSYKMAQLLPNAELHAFNRCGHWTQIEKTDEFINHIFAFIKE